MAVLEISRIQVRRGQENQTGVPTLAGGEFGWAADTEHLYIGLRREDGGARDANVRVLTENDLFTVITSLDLGYTYRSETNPAITAPTFAGLAYQRPINKKLDDFVSIKDFNVKGTGGDDVDSALIQVAIDKLFLDPLKTTSNYGKIPTKVLYMPAGTYNIDTAIFVPRYTTIIGEGVGKTIINLISTASHAFQTIDSDPDNVYGGRSTFDQYGINSGITQPNYFHIEGVTIQYSTTTTVTDCLSLISLDCSENAIIRDVKFSGNHVANDSATSTYVGVDIRGYGGLLASSENVLIDNCEFTGLYDCIKSDYDIISPVIQNSKFSDSVRGVVFNYNKDNSADVGPRNSRILNNRFENIEEQAIYVGHNSTAVPTNHISMNNKFYNVGNLGRGRAATTGTAIITYLSDGNLTINDFYDRQEYQKENIYSTQLYLPLVEGKAKLDDTGVKSISLATGAIVKLMRFPLTPQLMPQELVISYSGSPVGIPGNVFRVGKASFTIPRGLTPDVTCIVDDYMYGDATDGGLTWTMYASSAYKFYEIRVTQNTGYEVVLEYSTNLTIF